MVSSASASLSTGAVAPLQPPSVNRDPSAVAEETTRLFELIGTGELDRDELIEQVVVLNLPLADSLARRFRHRGEEDDDLTQVARSGLTEAAHRYQPDRGPFASFAVPTILGVLKRHFRDKGWTVRPPRHQQEVAMSMRQAWPELTQTLHAEPTDVQLAEYIGETEADVRAARLAEHGYRPVALDISPTEGLHAESDDEPQVLAAEARLLVEEAMHHLDEDEQRLLRMRFYQGRTQSDIAGELGVSQMQVSRLLSRVMTKLRGVIGPLEAPAADDGVLN